MPAYYQRLHRALQPIFKCPKRMLSVLTDAADHHQSLEIDCLSLIELKKLSSEKEWNATATSFIFRKVPVSILMNYI